LVEALALPPPLLLPLLLLLAVVVVKVVIVVDFAVGDGITAVVSVFPPSVHNFGAQIVQAAAALVGSFTGAPNYG
jgi:hypothetical protein